MGIGEYLTKTGDGLLEGLKESSVTRLYEELLSAVHTKFPGESKHETALRYIKGVEEITQEECKEMFTNLK